MTRKNDTGLHNEERAADQDKVTGEHEAEKVRQSQTPNRKRGKGKMAYFCKIETGKSKMRTDQARKKQERQRTVNSLRQKGNQKKGGKA